MNKSELISAVAEKTQTTKTVASQLVNSLLDVIQTELKSGNEVSLAGFGIFAAVKRAERTSRNPATGSPIKVPATVVPKFKPAKALKDAVAESK